MNLNKFIEKKPLIIAGPCSAESKNQLLNISNQIKDYVDIFRAGVWKPRTNPNNFEGYGEKALNWLSSVKKQTGLKTATEVATAKHVEKCLYYDIDVLWIGARTTVNPFYIEEIAEALRGVDIEIYIKNPIHPELSLWIGAVERIYNKGVKKIAAIHRGFYTYELSAYRNEPKWEIPIELKRELPEINILCDPSHIAGSKELIPELSQTAMDLNMDGLMIETHNNPYEALSDANQQVKPKNLKKIISDLILRDQSEIDKNPNNELNLLRNKIDQIDKKIITNLSKRNDIVEEIANLKMNNNLAIFQIKRWYEILSDRECKAESMEIDSNMILDIFKLIHKYSILTQSKIMKK
tara:strand:+ start:4801 stop:5856 length:1056 start_codon:yes stop_codon:yes gene_type:complete